MLQCWLVSVYCMPIWESAGYSSSFPLPSWQKVHYYLFMPTKKDFSTIRNWSSKWHCMIQIFISLCELRNDHLDVFCQDWWFEKWWFICIFVRLHEIYFCYSTNKDIKVMIHPRSIQILVDSNMWEFSQNVISID